MANTGVGRGSDQVKLRLPDGMRDKLKEAAKVNGRSLNAEIIARLESFKAQQTNTQLDRMEKKIDRLVFYRSIENIAIFPSR